MATRGTGGGQGGRGAELGTQGADVDPDKVKWKLLVPGHYTAKLGCHTEGPEKIWRGPTSPRVLMLFNNWTEGEGLVGVLFFFFFLNAIIVKKETTKNENKQL